MRIYLHLLAAFFLFFAGSIYANTQQEKRVTGKVTSEGEPLPGVSVQLKGASSGTITDIDGNYSIEAPVNGTLVFRFVGMKTVEQPVNNRNVINVTLDSESKELEEVMVVAYATAKKYSFTGAASTMKAGEIEKLQTSSVSRVLEGTVSGVQASAASGQPGTDADAVYKELQERLSGECVDFRLPHGDAFMESVAMCGEEAMEQYLQTGEVSRESIAHLIWERKLVMPSVSVCPQMFPRRA